jgi:hypothetical protein
VFQLPHLKKRQPVTNIGKHHRNPMRLTQEWQQALDEGIYASQAELARHLGVSRARISQVLRLMKLPPATCDAASLSVGVPGRTGQSEELSQLRLP